MSDRVKKEIMGHSSSEMSDRYAHVPLQEAIAAIDLIPSRWCEEETQQAWRSDVTYIPMAKGFLYLVVIMEWASRLVLARRLSNTLGADFCVAALEAALARYGRPEIFNTDQGSQFTSDDFTGTLKHHGITISMDGKGRCMDNIFVERLWRSLKYEEVYLKAYATVAEAKAGIGAWLSFYNEERQHQSLGYRTPRQIYEEGLWVCGRSALPNGSASPASSEVGEIRNVVRTGFECADSSRFSESTAARAFLSGPFWGPVRATIPLAAGSMQMPRGRFWLANVASALIWAPMLLFIAPPSDSPSLSGFRVRSRKNPGFQP